MPPTFDIYDQAALTQLINEPVDTALESAPRLGDQIAPFQNTESRLARMDIGRTYSFGIGQYKAPNAMPALVEMPVTERKEALIEMIQLEEMHRINSEQWIRLRSNDENVRRAEGLDIVDRGVILRRRMERLTEKMRWDVFTTGALTVTYPRTNSQLFIDYGFLPGHKPVVSVSWSDIVLSDPVADMEGWQQQLADDSGQMGLLIHLTSADAKLVLQNQKLKTYFNVPVGTPFRPTLQQVASLLADGTQFVIYDAGWRPMMSGADRSEAAHTRYLPVGTVLMTTKYSIEGENIADTLNGQVDISVAYNEAEPVMGPANEVILNHLDKNRYLREAACRIVRLLHVEAFLAADVTGP
jgi:hypothetical protein